MKKIIKIMLVVLFVMFGFSNINGNSNAYAQGNLTPIMEKSQATQATKAQAIQQLRKNNSVKTDAYIQGFVDITWEEAAIEGVRADVAFSLMMLETGWLQFGGDVKESQNNFGGLGATGGGNPGNSFPDIRTGIKAVVQHLKAYASTDPLQAECVDPRFQYVTRSSAEYIEWLGIKENPEGYGWAAGDCYGYKIINITRTMQGLSQLTFVGNLSIKYNNQKIATYYTNRTHSITANAISVNKPLYRFWIGYCSNGKWTWNILQDYSTNNKTTWMPTKPGLYEINVHVRDSASDKEYEAVKYYDITVNASPTKIDSLDIGGTSFITGKTYTATANATSANKPMYRFWLGNLDTGKWTIIQDYSAKNTADWKATTPGRYEVNVHVRDSASDKEYEAVKYYDITVNASPTKIDSLDIGGTSFIAGKTYTATANATCANKPMYRFWLGNLDTGKWTIIQDYSTKNTADWKATTPGRYEVNVHVRDSASNKEYEAVKYYDITVNASSTKIDSLDIGGTSFIAGKTYTATANATCANKPMYRFWLGNLDTGKWTIIQDYSTKNTADWKATTPGRYEVNVHVRDSASNKEYEAVKYYDITVNASPTKIDSLDIGGTSFIAGKTYTATANATCANKPMYRFWLGNLDTGKWTIIQDYSTKNTADWKATTPGRYEVNVHVRDSASNKEYEAVKYYDITVNASPTKIDSLDIGGTSFIAGKTYTATANATCANKPMYRFWLGNLDTGKWTIIQDYSTKNTADWKATTPGRYEVNVHVRDSASNKEYEAVKYYDITVNAVLYGKTIVLDAGHGGIDGGAISSVATGSLKEAVLNEQQTRILGELLKGYGVNVIYTRDIIPPRDYLITEGQDLQNRVDVANGVNADLFLSIHHNSFEDTSVNGVETYYCSSKLSSETVEPSITLARELVDNIANLGFYNRGHKNANFKVIKNTTMPSVLIEAGFMSNDNEVKRVASKSVQESIAQKIVETLLAFYSI